MCVSLPTFDGLRRRVETKHFHFRKSRFVFVLDNFREKGKGDCCKRTLNIVKNTLVVFAPYFLENVPEKQEIQRKFCKDFAKNKKRIFVYPYQFRCHLLRRLCCKNGQGPIHTCSQQDPYLIT
jgi:hypothetical protein